MSESYRIGKTIVKIVKGDITEMATDAIVNAANSSLMGGGGVDGAIHRVGGPEILKECKTIRDNYWRNGLPTGKAVITTGGRLRAKYVIHTVGPIWHGGTNEEPLFLKQAYENSMKIAVSKGLKTIAFPSISTGAYGYPIEEASRIALKTIGDFLKSRNFLEEVIFVLFSEKDQKIYLATAKEIFALQ